MQTPRTLTLADVRISKTFEVVAAPVWAFKAWKVSHWRCEYSPIKELWTPLQAELGRRQKDRLARIKKDREQEWETAAATASDPSADPRAREYAMLVLQCAVMRSASRWEPTTRGLTSILDLTRNSLRRCRVCDTEFFAYGKTRACSDACAKKRRDTTRTPGKTRDRRVCQSPRACGFCPKTFTPKRSDTRFCSPRCRVSSFRSRQDAGAT